MGDFPRHTAAQGPIAVYEPFEVVIELGFPVEDPFRTVTVTGSLGLCETAGFCDSADGSVYRWRAMATEAGTHDWEVRVEGAAATYVASGTLTAEDQGRRGPLQAEGWGWIWAGTREPFFWLGTTAYMAAGLREDLMLAMVNRMAVRGANHLRVSICPSRQKDAMRWVEPDVQPNADFTFHYGPWIARQPDSQEHPDFDVTRFDVAYWQKYESLVRCALDRGVMVQAIFFTDAQEPQNYPFGDRNDGHDPDERRYFAYAVARLGAFPNIEYCVTNEWALYRTDESVEVLGEFLASLDAYGHPISVHGHGHFPFRASRWCTHALFQVWDEDGGYEWMLDKRREQEATGRIIPQINEEYGYEDHYPVPWGNGKVAPARNADSRRRIGWEIAMAGGWQTTGEAAGSTGGWVNGWTESALLDGYAEMRRFFESFDFWDFSPEPALFAAPWRGMRSADGRVVLYQPESGPVPAGYEALLRVELCGGDAALLLRRSRSTISTL